MFSGFVLPTSFRPPDGDPALRQISLRLLTFPEALDNMLHLAVPRFSHL